MRLLGKLILIVTSLWLLFSLYAIFWEPVTAVVLDRSNISLTQNGYNGVSKPGVSNFNGSSTAISFASYRYILNEKTYTGNGNVSLNSGRSIKVYVCPAYPEFSITNNTIPLPWLFLLYILGFSFIEMNNWFRSLQKHP